MKTELKKLPKSQIEIAVDLSAQELEPYVEAAVRELSRANTIRGFRPGFAPKDVIVREFGQAKITEVATDLAIKENYRKALMQNQLEILGEPKVTLGKSGVEGVSFKINAAVWPQVELGDYKKINVPVQKIHVDEKEIESALADIKNSRAENIAVPRPAQKGDRVEVDFTVKKDGSIIEDGESKQHPMVLGEGHFMAGFEDELVGLKENETKNFSLIAPADYHNKSLAGQKLDFEVKVNLVQERKLPELTDDFVKTLGNFQTIADLKNNVKEGLTLEKQDKAKMERRNQMAKALIKETKADLPQELIDLEMEKMTAELVDSLARMNLTLENYLGHIKKTPEELKQTWLPQAEERIKVSLALREIAQKENIQVGDEEIEAKLAELMRSAPPLRPGQNLDLTALRGYVKSLIRNEKVFEVLENQ